MNEIEKSFKLLSEHPDFRVLRRFDERAYPRKISAQADVGTGLILDTETTGRDTQKDAIVELGLVAFSFDRATGEVLSIVDTYGGLEDPGVPIPLQASRVNGITDDMVRGQRIDEAHVEQMLSACEFVIAHNAAFDRPFCERRFSKMAEKPWACSLTQIDWEGAGISSGKLEFIAYRLGFFYDAHRATSDCLALMHALNQPLPDGERGLKKLLDAYLKPTVRIWAKGSPFDAKEKLRDRGYRWSDGSKPGTEKSWYTEVSEADANKEGEWLRDNVFGGHSISLPIDITDAYTRFSERAGRKQRMFV
jgi:DNA polymerase-3 subunit epsilon